MVVTETDLPLVLSKQDCVSKKFNLLHSSGVCLTQKSQDKEGPNEDAFLAMQLDEGTAVLAVADGLGGYSAGEYAATLQLSMLRDKLKSIHASDLEHGTEVRNSILDAIDNCNQQLLSENNRSATTILVVEINDNRLRTYHAGDSSAILVGQRGALKMKTLSHSNVSLGIEAGLLEPHQETEHEDRHYLTNYVGTTEMRIDISTTIESAKFDTLLLCSDGLTDNLSIEDITAVIRAGSIEKCLQNLQTECAVAMQQENGRFDDLTLCLFRPGLQR